QHQRRQRIDESRPVVQTGFTAAGTGEGHLRPLSLELTLSRRSVTDRFDVVAVRVKHKGPVVVGMIMRPNAGRSVVPAPGRDRFLMEAVDGCAIGRIEGDMSPRLR